MSDVYQQRIARLKQSVHRLHKMRQSEVRDSLIFDLDNMISRIQHHTFVDRQRQQAEQWHRRHAS